MVHEAGLLHIEGGRNHICISVVEQAIINLTAIRNRPPVSKNMKFSKRRGRRIELQGVTYYFLSSRYTLLRSDIGMYPSTKYQGLGQ